MVLTIKPTFLAIIPARSGSKGLPQKNIREVAGKPLIAWTLEAALASEYLTDIIVSSDGDAILEVAKKKGVKAVKRPDELASDTASSEAVVEHIVDLCLSAQQYFDYIVLLQPTSPARNEHHIDQAINLLLSRKASSLISVSEPEHSPLKAFKLNEEGYLSGLIDNDMPFMRRQDLMKTFLPNGAIYIVAWEQFLQDKKLFTNQCCPYEMTEIESIDIDNMDDLIKFQEIMKKKHASSN